MVTVLLRSSVSGLGRLRVAPQRTVRRSGWAGVGGGGGGAKTSRCVRAVRLGPVSDTPSLRGVGAVGCIIMSPWALCNYALT